MHASRIHLAPRLKHWKGLGESFSPPGQGQGQGSLPQHVTDFVFPNVVTVAPVATVVTEVTPLDPRYDLWIGFEGQVWCGTYRVQGVSGAESACECWEGAGRVGWKEH